MTLKNNEPESGNPGNRKLKNSKLKNSKLLSVLFILIIIPVVLLLARSASLMITQRRTIEEIWGRYVRQLAWYGAARFDKVEEVGKLRDFLALLQDRGYERIMDRMSGRENFRDRDRGDLDMSGKFIPGFLAYIERDGTFIAGSGQSELLSSLWDKHQEKEYILDGMELASGDRREEITYTLCVWPTKNPEVVAVAAVVLNAWGVSRSPMTRFVYHTMFAALFCLIALMLLRKVLISPLRSLFFGLRFEWGKEAPKFEAGDGKFLGLQVEEITSLRSAISELAQEAIEKRELEQRYVGDIVKTQEDERNRLAREIHDGPVQSVAALIQRIQMASLSSQAGSVQEQLALAEEAAQNAVEDLRGICDSLVPPWVSLGLVRCMEETASRLTRQYDVTIETDIDSAIELSQDKTLAFFRIFQEGVSNAVRHGHAAHLKLSINSEQNEISFVLRDDGAGFNAKALGLEALYASGRRGLVGMKQRVESFGGIFSVISAPGEGAVIEVRFK